MKSPVIAALRKKLLAQGVTPLPVCPTCESPIPAKEWDRHQAACTTR